MDFIKSELVVKAAAVTLCAAEGLGCMIRETEGEYSEAVFATGEIGW